MECPLWGLVATMVAALIQTTCMVVVLVEIQ